jgi:hypothetical protein
MLQRSERVKCIEFNTNEPLMLAALYSGKVQIWNYETQASDPKVLMITY